MPGGHRKDICSCGEVKQANSQKCQKCARKNDITINPELLSPEGFEVSGDRAHKRVLHNKEIRTLEEMIAICEIDTEVWEVERYVCNKWEVAAKVGTKESKQLEKANLWQIKVWLKRKLPQLIAAQEFRKEFVNEIRRNIRPASTVRHRYVSGGWLMEFTPFDLHVGKLAWGEETVTNYDTGTAVELFHEALEFLLEKTLKLTDGQLERVLCVFGNDVMHIDNKSTQTTGGTQMDFDTRYIKAYRRVVTMHRQAIDKLRKIAPVDIVVVPGNHDELTSFHLGEILEAYYSNDKHVSVNNSPRLRKYYEFGDNLLGFTHGHAEKVTELPLLMAREMPEAWSRCSSREWHIGHKHIVEKISWHDQDLFSDKGVRVRRLPSLSAHDAWHTKHAYTDRRACESFIFHKEAGFTSQLSFNVDHFTGESTSK